MPSFRIITKLQQKAAVDAILDLDLDGKHTVKIVASGGKSARQRRYYWLLLRTIAKSGKGDADTAEELDLKNKYRFRDVFFQDNEMLSELFAHVVVSYPDQIKRFISEYVHTERLSKAEMANYLTNLIAYYGRHVDLPIPEEIGLLDY